MRKIIAISLCAIAIVLVIRSCQKSTLPEPYRALYQEVLAPVVKITSKAGTGSGVVISHRRDAESIYILSAAHVVGNEKEVTVYIYEYDLPVVTIELARVVSTDTVKDLALLKLNPSNPHNLRLRSAKLASRNYKPYLFTEVYAVGCSLGYPPRPSSGLISAFSGSSYEISAPILPGNSGGGVFLKDTHQLIGITVWVRTYHGQLITTMAGVVPIQEIYEFLDRAKSIPTLRRDALRSEGGEVP